MGQFCGGRHAESPVPAERRRLLAVDSLVKPVRSPNPPRLVAHHLPDRTDTFPA